MHTKSERLFEGYLRSQGLSGFEFEPAIEGTTKRPDYSLVWNTQRILLEVKEFAATPADFKSGFGAFDPYPPLREKINQARAKFKNLKGHCCALVLHNINKPLILLDWKHIAAAMLGNLAFQVPLGKGDPESVKVVFSSGGKMHKEMGGIPTATQNTTISAVIVLNRFPLGETLFRRHTEELEATLGRKLTGSEYWEELDRVRCREVDLRRKPLRVVVHENPYAAVKFPAGLFCGPYDERYGDAGGYIDRLFRGAKLEELESAR